MKIALLMMQKNENELIDKWAHFHGKLFGYENLYIYDNGSTESETLKKLFEIKNLGCNINSEFTTKDDFEAKGDILGNKIKELEKDEKYDFYIPLDCDEFLGVYDDGYLSFTRESIEKELTKYINTKDVLLNKNQYLNSPISKMHFRKVNTRKTFFYRGNFKSLDIGFHWGKNNQSTTEIHTNIIQIHFHQKPFDEIKKYARQKLALRVDINDKNKLKIFRGAGQHLTQYFFMDELDYVKITQNKHHIFSDSLLNEFKKLNIDWPYNEKIENQNLFSNHLTSELLSSPNAIHPHKIYGNLDQVKIEGKNLILKGWALDRENTPFEQFHIVINKKLCFTPTSVNTVKREDIQRLKNTTHSMLGFSLSFNLNELIESNVFINSLDLYPTKNKREISTPLSVKEEKIMSFLIDVNDFNYRNSLDPKEIDNQKKTKQQPFG